MSGTVAGWIAVGALAVALVALVVARVLACASKDAPCPDGSARVGSGGSRQLRRFPADANRRSAPGVDEIAAGLVRVDTRVDGALSRSAIVRFDAYEDVGGQQSASLAFLDAARSGIVLTAIQGRDYARIYVKELDRGHAPVGLSPEEREAVERAMAAV